MDRKTKYGGTDIDVLSPSEAGAAVRDGSFSCHMPVHSRVGFRGLYQTEQVELLKYFMQLSERTPNLVFAVTSRWNGYGPGKGLNCDVCIED